MNAGQEGTEMAATEIEWTDATSNPVAGYMRHLAGALDALAPPDVVAEQVA